MSEALEPKRDYHAEFIAVRDLDPEEHQAYFAERVAKIKDGHPTWMARNFESEGICFDYFVDHKPVAHLLFGGWDTRGYETYYTEGGAEDYEGIEEAVDAVEARFSEANEVSE